MCTYKKLQEINCKISVTLINYKEQNNLSNIDMANKLGISLNYYLAMENFYNFSMEELARITNNLKIHIEI